MVLLVLTKIRAKQCLLSLYVAMAAVSSFCACQSDCNTDILKCGYNEPCPESPGVYYFVNTGIYKASKSVIMQDTCTSGLSAIDLDGKLFKINYSTNEGLISVVKYDNDNYGSGTLRCNKASMVTYGSSTGSCRWSSSRHSFLQMTHDNTAEVKVLEERDGISGACPSALSQCSISYEFTLSP